ncbi:hypothetical protein [Amycolatopsis sp. NPDC051102]|uniref:hypothetical protein n=1 Tax=Amycolatopsis sp. NPDC051102 TaxID=3155163 RepID=UPI00341D6D54
MSKLIRVLAATTVLPGAALAVAAALAHAWAGRLPDPVATHWHGAPDGATPLGLFAGVCLALGAVVTVMITTTALTALRRGRPLPRLSVGMGAGFAVLPPAVLLSVLVPNLDVPDWHAARSGAVVLFFLLGTVAAGVAAGFAGGFPAPVVEDRAPRPSVGL